MTDERQVQLYDTTLRDGMQQEGMSVSVDEKARIALKLDELGIGFIEGGFPGLQPQGDRVLPAHARRAAPERGARRLRHDAAQGRVGRGRRGPARAGGRLHAHGRHRRQDLGSAPEQGHPREPRREPAHDRRVGPVPHRAGQARGVRRRALLRRLARRRGVRAALRDRGRRGGRRGRLPVRHQRGQPAAVRRGRRPRGHGGPARHRGRHPHAQRLRLRRGQQPHRHRGRRRATCRAPSTATASAAATPTSSASSRRSSSRWATT